MMIVTGSVTARAETFEDLRHASLAHVRRSRAEDGCLLHSVQVDCENPLRLVFYEERRDMAALQRHFTQSGTLAFLDAVRALAAGSESIAVWEATDVEFGG